jgi:hypothetical protein
MGEERKFVRSKDGSTRLDPATGLKICCHCKIPKLAEEFSRCSSKIDGLSPRCKACQSVAGKAYHAVNRDRVIAARIVRDTNNPERMMLRAARKRAKDQGVPFCLTEDDITIPEYCPVKDCGRKLVGNVGGGRALPSSPSLDKYSPALGYVCGNVWIICHECNARKQNFSGEELVAFGINLIEGFKEECERVAQLQIAPGIYRAIP